MAGFHDTHTKPSVLKKRGSHQAKIPCTHHADVRVGTHIVVRENQGDQSIIFVVVCIMASSPKLGEIWSALLCSTRVVWLGSAAHPSHTRQVGFEGGFDAA